MYTQQGLILITKLITNLENGMSWCMTYILYSIKFWPWRFRDIFFLHQLCALGQRQNCWRSRKRSDETVRWLKTNWRCWHWDNELNRLLQVLSCCKYRKILKLESVLMPMVLGECEYYIFYYSIIHSYFFYII